MWLECSTDSLARSRSLLVRLCITGVPAKDGKHLEIDVVCVLSTKQYRQSQLP
jgi:hypothetical protein